MPIRLAQPTISDALRRVADAIGMLADALDAPEDEGSKNQAPPPQL